MADYYDKQRAKVAIMSELVDRGWKIYGYTPNQSDAMTDYWSPAHWDGIAAKNGYVLLIDVSEYDLTHSSGRQIIEQTYSPDHAKIAKLRELANDSGATDGEKAAALARIDAIQQRAKQSTRILDTWPTFAHANPGHSSWHIEKDGVIVAQGSGVYSVRVSNSHIEENGRKQAANVCRICDKFESAISSGECVTQSQKAVTKVVNVAHVTPTGTLSIGQCIQINVNFSGGCAKGIYQCVRTTCGAFIFVRLDKKLARPMSENTPGNSMWVHEEWLKKYMDRGSISWAEVVAENVTEYKTVYKRTTRKPEPSDTLAIEDATPAAPSNVDDSPASSSPIEAEAAAQADDTQHVSVTLNAEHNGIEITFQVKPSEAVREQLKSHGFRWSRPQQLWYAHQSPERITWAEGLTVAT